MARINKARRGRGWREEEGRTGGISWQVAGALIYCSAAPCWGGLVRDLRELWKAELENISDSSRETQTWSRATAGVISCHFIQFGQSCYRAATQPGQYPVIEIRYVKRNNTRGEGATNCLHWTAGCMVGISAVKRYIGEVVQSKSKLGPFPG